MKALIENNEMAVADLEISAKGKIADILVVRKVRPQYSKDAEGKITDRIEAVRYDCVDPETYAPKCFAPAGKSICHCLAMLVFFDEEEEEDEAATDDLITAGIDPYDFELMDEDEQREALENAGLDPDDYDFD